MSTVRLDDGAVLDAARACVLDVGVRRTTLADVARRAGVSRMSLYRRWSGIDELVGDVLTRELHTLTGDALDGDRAALVARVVEVCEALRRHGLVRKIVDVDPELLLPYVTERVGAFQKLVIDGLATRLAEAMDEGTVRRADPRRLAAAMELAMRGYVLAAHADAPDDERAHREDLRMMLDAFLTP